MPDDQTSSDQLDDIEPTETTDEAEQTVPTQVEVRRNVALAAGIGGFAALLTAAFAARAFTGGTGLDWLAFAVLGIVTVVHLASLTDSRAPLLVADAQGVRVRQGATWRGIAWAEIDCMEHLPRRGLLRDGHLLVDGYDDQQLVVPLTLATRVVGAPDAVLSDVLAALADGRADVVEVVPGFDEDGPVPAETPVPTLSDLYRDDAPAAEPGERRGIAARVAAGLSGAVPSVVRPAERSDRGVEDGSDVSDDTEATDEILLAQPADPAVDQDTGEIPVVRDEHDDHPDHHDDYDEYDEPPAPDRPTLLAARVERDSAERARPEHTDPPSELGFSGAPVGAADSAAGDEHESMTVVLDDLAIRPAPDPVIGPDVAAARERLRLSIDQVSDRTRIRPHVIEAIEVDDFGPCGGDFYARGHLRTLARVLGIDAAPLLASYDERYAHAPIDPRRVFESELATGTGAIRSTRGGRNWSVMIAAVMGAVLIWSIARLVMGGPDPASDNPGINFSGGITGASPTQGDPVKLTLTAAGGGATLNVRDAAGKIVFEGNLAFGQTTELKVVAPIRIYSTDGSVTYAVGAGKARALGETGAEANKTVVAPKRGS